MVKMSRGARKESIFEEMSKDGPCDGRFESNNLLPKNLSKYHTHGAPDIKKYSEREVFIGRDNEKKPKPDYNPKKEILLKPLGIGNYKFSKQLSRN